MSLTSSQRDRKLKQTDSPPKLYAQPKYWAECFGTAPYLPMSREEMDALGWDSCDIIIVTADAYVDHPSFGMAVVGRVLEAQGYRVGIISQPNWSSAEAFKALGQPNLFFGVTAGNMDSLINRFTADLRKRSDDAYTPGGVAGKRPDRSVIVYSQRCREAYYDTPIVIGGIEASLRRIAQYDYWSDAVRRSVLIDSNADILLSETPSGPWSSSPTASPAVSPSRTSGSSAAPPSSRKSCLRTGLKSTQPESTGRLRLTRYLTLTIFTTSQRNSGKTPARKSKNPPYQP